MTCTPYGINSHRLLVRGHRVPYTPELAADLKTTEGRGLETWMYWMIGGAALGLGVLGVMVFGVRRRRARGRRALPPS